MEERRSVLRDLVTRPWVQALCYLLVAVFVAWLGWSGLWDVFSVLGHRPGAWYTLVTAVPSAGLVLLKRRAPRTGLVLAIVLFLVDLLTLGGLVPLLVVLEMLDTYLLTIDATSRRRALAAVVGGTALMSVAMLLLSRDLQQTVLFSLQIGALFGFSYWYATSMAQSRELVRLYRQRSENAKRLAQLDRETAVQVERERMARDLHDVVAGHITAVAIRSEAALGLPAGADHDVAGQEALRAVRDSSLEAHSALRSMIEVLRSGQSDLSVPPGRAQLQQLVSEAQASGVRVRLRDTLETEPSGAVDQTIGRVVQEALSNSVRHASGATVEVGVEESAHDVTVLVRSTGGVALEAPALRGSGLGLAMLSERVSALGGTWTAGPEEHGWLVRADLPKEVRG